MRGRPGAIFRVYSSTTSLYSAGDPTDLPRFVDVENLHPASKKAIVKDFGLTSMTEIQAKTFKAASSGKDILGRARTGTGKTLAFLLPAIETLLKQKDFKAGRDIGILILSPTRELAMQIHEQARTILFRHGNNMNSNFMYGGTSKKQEIDRLCKRMPTVLAATPGRLIDHLQSSTIHGTSFAKLVKGTKVLVLDETDRLLDMGFKRDIDRILSYLSPKRQTLLFSATLPPGVRSVMADCMRPDYQTIDCIHDFDPATQTNSQVNQRYVVHPESMQIDAPIQIIRNIMDSNPNHKIMAFFPTANMTSFYSQIFSFHLSRPVIEIHSRKSQAYRSSACNRFKEKKGGITMFTSDVSARGMDFSGVSHVIQVGMPDSRETYIHRLGRTGRAGKEGEGILILSEVEQAFLTKELSGLDIINDENLLAYGGDDAIVKTSDLASLRRIIGEGKNESLSRATRGAYASMLGYYASKLKSLGVRDKKKFVNFVNSFSKAAGLVEPPSVTAKVAESIGLRGVQGINISNRKQGDRGGRSGGGRSKNLSGKGTKRSSYQRHRQKSRGKKGGNSGSVQDKGNYSGWGDANRWQSK